MPCPTLSRGNPSGGSRMEPGKVSGHEDQVRRGMRARAAVAGEREEPERVLP